MSKEHVYSFICSVMVPEDLSGKHVLREAWLTNELLQNKKKHLQKQKSYFFWSFKRFKFVKLEKSQKRYRLYFQTVLLSNKENCVCVLPCRRSVIRSVDATSKLFIVLLQIGVLPRFSNIVFTFLTWRISH